MKTYSIAFIKINATNILLIIALCSCSFQAQAETAEYSESERIINSVYNYDPHLPPDVSALTDPPDPNAPVDAHLWFLLLLLTAFGAYQYKKQGTKNA
jgi:hypothetical protein